MCYGCWEEVGKPLPTDAARACLPLLEALEDESCTGGNLHIVTDDFNTDDDCLTWCRDNSEFTPVEQAVFDAFMPLSPEQRTAALALRDGFVT